MKAEVQKPGIFSRALSVLTYNWWLKLLALLLLAQGMILRRKMHMLEEEKL